MTIAIYVRQSVDKQDSISIENQIDLCKREISSKANHIVYSDKGYSGKDTNRPRFERMMTDVRNGLVSKVVVYKLDRISRSTLDFAKIINTFKEYNVDFISTTEKFDTSTPIGKAMLQIIMIFAELERETIQLRITDNYYARGRKGMYLGGPPPYGYSKTSTTINGKKTSMLIEDKSESVNVKKMYELYSTTDMSLGQISDYLNDRGIPTKQGKKWDSGKISRVMKTPVHVQADADVYLYYKNRGSIISNDLSDFIGLYGCYLFGKRNRNERKYTNVKDHILSLAPHKGIVDSKTWLKCQYKLDRNKQIKNTGKGKYTWLTGIIKCGHCGYSASAVFSDGKYLYFSCRGKHNLKICDGLSEVAHVRDIESRVEQVLLKKVEEVEGINYNSPQKSTTTNQIKLEIIEVDNQIENLLNQLANANNIAMSYINRKLTELDTLKNELEEQMKQETISNSQSVSMDDIFSQIRQWEDLSLEDKRVVASSFIEKVSLKGKEIIIDWRF